MGSHAHARLARRRRHVLNGRLRILVSAYACEPGRGSEPGVGWNWVRQIARHHDVTVITRSANRAAIEGLSEPLPDVHFEYFDLPRWARFWKRGKRGLYMYYYLWQIGAYLRARCLHRADPFDIAHHVTFVTYWMPSFLALLPIPFIWGPVGGGESTPRPFLRLFSARGIVSELLRSLVQGIGRLDPFVKLTARRSALAFAATQQTADRLIALGCRRVEILSAMGLPADELDELAQSRDRTSATFRIATLGDLVHWKGGELGLRAFAKFSQGFPNAGYWFIGDGFERDRLERLSRELDVKRRVMFWGKLPRQWALSRLSECDVLLHPSLHDSGGCVCSEALAAGRPVICLNLGGPALQVTADTGFKIEANSPGQVIDDLAHAMTQLASDRELYRRMSAAARRHARTELAWDDKGDRIAAIYRELAPAARAIEYAL